jgi:hypothetical protein
MTNEQPSKSEIISLLDTRKSESSVREKNLYEKLKSTYVDEILK